MRVLCVENTSASLNKLQHVLHEAGYEVITASSGQEAISVFIDQPVDGVLLECDLPDENGVAVRDEMKQIKPEVAVLLLAGIGPRTRMLLRFFDAYLRGQSASPGSEFNDIQS
jgi:DNA-binding response OmpR family regulator